MNEVISPCEFFLALLVLATLVVLTCPGTPLLYVDIAFTVVVQESLTREFFRLPNTEVVGNLSTFELCDDAADHIGDPR